MFPLWTKTLIGLLTLGEIHTPSLSKMNHECESNYILRGMHHKVKRRFVVGNVSKWIACDQREDLATHKWMIYVRGDRDHPDVSDVVAKVRFLIHPSYHPHDLVEVANAPFHLTRRGWGEFPARVQIHFR